jgi:hypothetical protein
MRCRFSKVTLLTLLAAGGAASSLHGETLFSDAFDTDSSANWNQFIGAYATDDADFKVDWAFDYGAQTYKLFAGPADPDGTELTVPPAPNSNGTSKGVKIAVNKDDVGSRINVSLFPKGQNFSGDYVLKFDMFMNHGSYGDLGGGTTENAFFGINHLGTGPNWGVFSGNGMSAGFVAPIKGADTSDGLFWNMTCDGGGAKDLWAQAGVAGGPPKVLFGDAGGILDLDKDTFPDHGDEQGNFTGTFSSPPFEAPGIIGKRWLAVEVSQVKNLVTMKVNGQVFSRYQNLEPWKSGTVMIGYADIFNSVSSLLEENWVLFDNVRVERIRTVVVNTADNGSTAGDGKTSLLEALQGLQENDIITFNIPGAGPHVITTPLGGYPLITKAGVTIDGYTQPGATPNTQGILEGNNASLKIVLDSSGTDAGPEALPARRSTRLPFPGYGDSENAILGIFEAEDVTVRGLSFRSRHTPGSDEDPSIYCVALVKEAQRAKIQGNWFGLDPDGKTVSGSASAVAGFRHRVNVNGSNVDTFSGYLTFGTDSDGVNDKAEYNVITGTHIALALELPGARIAGNYFNVLADGKTFLKPDDIHQAQLDSGRSAGDSSVENIENGRSTLASVIGTDGNGVNDAEERNIFNTVTYDHLIEFYSNAEFLKVAGNYFGVGVDGTTRAVASELKPTPDLIEVPGTASVVIGTNGDKKSDALEGNLVVGIPGVQFFVGGRTVLVAARGNTLLGNGFEAFPFTDGSGGRAYTDYYASVLTDASSPVPTLTTYTAGELSGTVPAPNLDNYPLSIIDIYVADAESTAPGVALPGKLIYSGRDNQDGEDLDAEPGKFKFALPAGSVPGGSQLVAVVTYAKDSLDLGAGATAVVSAPGRSVTGPASAGLAVAGGAPITGFKAVLSGTSVKLSFSGGTAPFQLQKKSTLTGAWVNEGAAFSTREVTLPAADAAAFFRVGGQ